LRSSVNAALQASPNRSKPVFRWTREPPSMALTFHESRWLTGPRLLG